MAPPPRAAVFECSCCGGSVTVPLRPGQRSSARRSCGNAGCWPCLGACTGTAKRTEVVRLEPGDRLTEAARQEPPPATLGGWQRVPS